MTETQAHRRGRWPWIAGAAVATLVLAIGICEALGWPFLVEPIRAKLAQVLDRKVLFAENGAAPSVRIGLLGGVRLDAGYLEIGAPSWSHAPHMLLVRDAKLRLAYLDLWRAYKGEPLYIRELQATSIDGQLERTADGRASWQFGNKPPSTSPSEPVSIPTFGRLQVAQGTLSYRDAPLTMDLDANFSLLEQQRTGASNAASAPEAAASSVPPGLQFHGKGTYLKLPFRVDLGTTGVLSVVGPDAPKIALPVTLDAAVGKARMTFRGTATDPVRFGDLKGTFSVKGPSLAAIGDPLKVTLPTTGEFDAEGVIAKTGLVWNTVVNVLSVGSSNLNGAFTYDPRPKTPILSGRLNGRRLALADLGPTIGAPPPKSGPSPETVKAAEKRPATKGGKVLPDRAFDLPSLRAMNANVLIDIADVDLGSSLLEPMRPLRGHLVLDSGVLSINDLVARTGQGSLGGSLRLDGRNNDALWNADLRLDNLRLSQWIHQNRGRGQPPYLSGDLDARIRVEGQGKSTAAILGSLKGGLRLNVVDGAVSHLGLEAAGLDVAQALGVFIKGDDAMKMNCAVADLLADHGTLKPRVMVIDTADSVVWVDGSLSLASEALDLRLLVSPKDFSPLALRTPIRVAGTFGDPSVSLEYGKLGGRVGAAALLAFVTPIAAVIPFFDTGSNDDAKRGAASCQALLKRISSHPQLSAPGTPTPISAPQGAQRQGVSPATDRPAPLPAGRPAPVVKLGNPSTR